MKESAAQKSASIAIVIAMIAVYFDIQSIWPPTVIVPHLGD